MLFDVYVSKTLYRQGNHVFGVDHATDLKEVNFIESLLFPG